MVTELISERLRVDRMNGYSIVPMLTPFHRDGSLDELSVSKLTQHILGGGCQCIMISGTTGEALSMNADMRIRLVEVTIRAMEGRGTLLFGIGHNCLEESVSIAKAGFTAGCDGVVAHLPSFYPLGERDMESWFLALADKIGGPMFVYNIPQTTGASIPVDLLERLSHHPLIVGMKDSERDTKRQLELARLFSERDDFAFFTGHIGSATKIMQAGAKGFVPGAANLCPFLAQEIMNTHLVEDYAAFDVLLQRLMEVSSGYLGIKNVGNALCSLKAAASIFGLCQPHVLLPLQAVDKEQSQRLCNAFEAMNLITPEIGIS